ncbi:MAG: anthranilate synthase component I, partial [Myxococcota bacterium]
MPSDFHVRRLHADLDTPVSAYLKLSQGATCSFLYESVEGRERWAAYSILGVGARRTITAADGRVTVTRGESQQSFDETDALRGLKRALADDPLSVVPDAPPFCGGIFGYLAYDAVRGFEKLPGVSGDAEVPDAVFFEPEVVAV